MKRLKNGILPICLSLLITFLAPMSLALAAEMAANEGAAGDNTMTRVALLDDDMSEIEINTVPDAKQNPKEGNRFEQGLLWWTAWGFDVFKTSAEEPKGLSFKFQSTGKKLYKKAFLTPINRSSDFTFEYNIHTASTVENGADVFAVINNKAVNNGDSDFPLWRYSSETGKLYLLGSFWEEAGKPFVDETKTTDNTFQLEANKPYTIKVDFTFNGYTAAGVDKYTATVTISDENGDVIGTYSKDDWIDNIYCKGQYALSDIIEKFGFAIYDGTASPESQPTLLTVSHVKVTEDVPNLLIADKAVSQFGLSTSYSTLFYDPEKAVAIGTASKDFDNGKVWAYGLAKGWDAWADPGPADVVNEYKNCFVPENGYLWINSRPTIKSDGYQWFTHAALVRAFSPAAKNETLSVSAKIRLAQSDQPKVGASIRLAKSQSLKDNAQNHNDTITLLSYIYDNETNDNKDKYGDLFFVGGIRDAFTCRRDEYNGNSQAAPETGKLYPFKLDGDAQNQELEVVLTAVPENPESEDSAYKVTTVLKNNAGTELIKCEKTGVAADLISGLDCIELTSGSQKTVADIKAEPIMGVKDIKIAHGSLNMLDTPQAELKSGPNSLYVPYINESGNDCKAVLIAAVYDKESNILKQCVLVDCPSIGVSGALKADVDIADLKTEYVKLFIFDSLGSLRPVSRPIQLGSE